MKRLSEKLLEYIETELNNEESRSRIKENIVAPSLSLLRDEIDKSGTDSYLTSVIHHLLWPVVCILVTTLALCMVIIVLQIYTLHFHAQPPRAAPTT